MLHKIAKIKKVFIVIIIITFIIILFNLKVYSIDTILRVAFDPNMPPYQFIENDQYLGVHIDILNKIAQKNNFIIEYIPIENISKCMEALENGEVDIVLGIMLNNNTKYKSELTENISLSSICMIVHNNKIENMQNGISSFVTTFENNTISYSFTRNIRNLRAIVVSNQVRAFNLLISGKADALIGIKDSIIYQLEKADIGDEYTIVKNFMVPIEYVMAVKPGDVDLQKKINKGLQQLRISGEYEDIYTKWINEDKYVIRKIIQKVIYVALMLSIIVVAIFMFNLRLNILLKKQVNEKTKELQKINKDLENQIIETRNYNEIKNCIVENSPSGIIVFDREYKITLFNKSASKLTDIYELPIRRSIFEVELLKNIIHDKKDAVFLPDSKFLYQEIVLKNKNEESISYRYNIYQLFDLNNNVRGAILTIEDITREIKIKEQIYEREKNKALNRIIAGIAHEIRNPLTSIKTFVELIPIKRDNVQFQNQLAEFVPKEVDRVSNLIKNLIDYAKPEDINKEDILIKDIIKSCTVLISHVLENEKIELFIDIDEELSIKADKNQIKQIIINIMLNGFDSMKEKIKASENISEKLSMDISAWEDDKNVFIQIIDEGIGMTEEEIKKAVEPFFTTKASGTGLGLYISKQYIEKNNGVMIIESERFKYTKITLKFEKQGVKK